ncbi:MAG: T9SS type A sorting domain-containing protein [Bacteroidales bacterium]|nr:T9SS type A sorting domain-containing protein [Bacteroidales bacterium]
MYFCSYSTAAQIELVIDPNTSDNTHSSSPECFVQYHGEEYFGATDFYGRGFWKSDGTQEGTVLVTRKVYPFHTFSFDGGILIIGHEQYGNPTCGLWLSDGTEEGTVLITDCNGWRDPQFSIVGNQLFFRLQKENLELWVTEGTVESTRKVTGITGTFTDPDYLEPVGNLLYFSASHADFGTETWRSDGTEAGTFQLKDISATSSNPYGFCLMNNNVYFIATNDSRTALYVTDGTQENTGIAATFPEYLVSLDHNASSLKEIHELGDTLYFGLKDNQSYMNDIYRYVEGDSVSLCYSFPQNSLYYPVVFYGLENALMAAVAYPNPRSPQELRLLRINGSGAEVYDSIMLSSSSWDYWEYQETDSVVYFEYAGHLKRTDGTSAGTYQVGDWYMSPYTSVGKRSFHLVNNRILFTCPNDTIGYELWIQDLANEEVFLTKDINLYRGYAGIEVEHSDNERIFFSATSAESGDELWITSAGGASASVIKDILPGSEGSNPRNFIWFGNELYFTADDASRQIVNGIRSSSNVWKSDGSPEGTVKVLDLNTGFNPGDFGNYEGSEKVELNGKMILAGSEPYTDVNLLDVELYESDGTPGGTQMLKNVNSTFTGFSGYSNPFAFRRVGERVFFAATTFENGTELWVTDGTEAGTFMVKDICSPGNCSSLGANVRRHNLTAFGDKLLFTPEDRENGRELWISDGTDTGTVRLTDIPEQSYTDYYYLTELNNRVIFWVDDVISEFNRAMWITDGTPDGTKALREVGMPSSWLSKSEGPLGVFNGQLFFIGTDGTHGFELWKTDGTAGGTVMVKDLFQGPAHSYPRGFIAVGNMFYFFAATGIREVLLWSSDGTTDGTVPMDGWDGDHMIGFGDATHCGEFLYFTASDLDHGEAMYRVFVGASNVPSKQVRSISIYPNPVIDMIRIDLNNQEESIKQINVIDLSGKVVLNQYYAGISLNENLDVSGLGPGMYLIRVETQCNIHTSKLLKQ